MRLKVVVLVAVIVLAVTTSCGKKPPEKSGSKPNVILITLDTTRKDHLSLYGYGRKTTPNLDKFAAEGAVFDAVFSSSSWTVPSHASIMTGLYSKSHGAEFEYQHLDPGYPTLAGILSGNGYDTAGFVVSPALNEWYGIGRGFKKYEQSFIKDDPDEKNELEMNAAIFKWLKQDRGEKPFFLFVNYFDPHNPYRHHEKPVSFVDSAYNGDLNRERVAIGENPERGDDRHINERVIRYRQPLKPEDLHQLVALYDEEIAYMDYCLGQLLGKLKDDGLLDNSIVIIVADHGESLTEHFLMSHGRALYKQLIDVPLVIYYPPQISAGTRVKSPAQNVDILPTVLDYAGISKIQNVSGVSLRDVIKNGKVDENRVIFAESYPDPSWTKWFSPRFNRKARVIISRHWKYFLYSDGEEELYNLEKDPEETKNLAACSPAVAKRMKNMLLAFDSSLPKMKPRGKTNSGVPEKTKEQLKSLGYLH